MDLDPSTRPSATELATGLAAAVNAALLYRGLRQQGVYNPGDGWGWLAGRLLFANIAMAIVVLWLSGDLESWLMSGWQDRAARLALCIGAGLVTYLFALMVSGVRPRHLVVRDV